MAETPDPADVAAQARDAAATSRMAAEEAIQSAVAAEQASQEVADLIRAAERLTDVQSGREEGPEGDTDDGDFSEYEEPLTVDDSSGGYGEGPKGN